MEQAKVAGNEPLYQQLGEKLRKLDTSNQVLGDSLSA
jgi:hypothetical protein